MFLRLYFFHAIEVLPVHEASTEVEQNQDRTQEDDTTATAVSAALFVAHPIAWIMAVARSAIKAGCMEKSGVEAVMASHNWTVSEA